MRSEQEVLRSAGCGGASNGPQELHLASHQPKLVGMNCRMLVWVLLMGAIGCGSESSDADGATGGVAGSSGSAGNAGSAGVGGGFGGQAGVPADAGSLGPPDPNGPLTIVLSGAITGEGFAFDTSGVYPLSLTGAGRCDRDELVACSRTPCQLFQEGESAALIERMEPVGDYEKTGETGDPLIGWASFIGGSQALFAARVYSLAVSKEALEETGHLVAHGNIAQMENASGDIRFAADIDFWIGGVCQE